MRATIYRAALAAFACLAVTTVQAAITITATSAGDGYWHNEAGSSYDYWDGASTGVSAYYAYWGTSDSMSNNTGYAQFPLATLPTGITVQSATLNVNLYERHYTDDSPSAGFIRHVANASGATGVASQKMGGTEQVVEIKEQAVGWLELDITAYLQNDLDSSYNFSCFSFNPNTSGYFRNAGFWISSSDSPTSKPYLSITLVPEPATSVLLVGASMLLLCARRRV